MSQIGFQQEGHSKASQQASRMDRYICQHRTEAHGTGRRRRFAAYRTVAHKIIGQLRVATVLRLPCSCFGCPAHVPAVCSSHPAVRAAATAACVPHCSAAALLLCRCRAACRHPPLVRRRLPLVSLPCCVLALGASTSFFKTPSEALEASKARLAPRPTRQTDRQTDRQ